MKNYFWMNKDKIFTLKLLKIILLFIKKKIKKIILKKIVS